MKARGMLRLLLTLALACVMVAPLQAGPKERQKLQRRIIELARYFEAIMEDQYRAVPATILRKSHGIILLRQVKAGFIRNSGGLALVKDAESGEWSAPAFVEADSSGWKVSMGGQINDTIFVIMTEEGLKILSNDNFQLGTDATAAAGPTGNIPEAATLPEVDILVYGEMAGLFAGEAFEGGGLGPDDKSNATFYNDPFASMRSILFRDSVEFPIVARGLVEMVEKYSYRRL